MIKVDEREMRLALIKRLSNYKNCYVFEEFTVPSGKARADVVAVNGHVIAYEIKSDYDSLKRLETQVPEYDLNFEMNYIVLGRKLFNKLDKIIPEYWGIILAEKNRLGNVVLSFQRKAHLNPNLSFESFISLLTSEEVKKIAMNDPAITKSYSKNQIRTLFKQDVIKIIYDNISLNKKRLIKHFIRDNLKSRLI